MFTINRKQTVMNDLENGCKFGVATAPEHEWQYNKLHTAGWSSFDNCFRVDGKKFGSAKATAAAMEQIAPLGKWSIQGD